MLDRVGPPLMLLFCGAVLARGFFGHLFDQREMPVGFSVAEVGRESGLSFVHNSIPVEDSLGSKGMESLVTSLGSSVSVADVNGDGYRDLFFGDSTFRDPQHHLYINSGDGTFVERSRTYGLDKIKAGILRSAFFDSDNDGSKELFVTTLDGFQFYKQNKKGTYMPLAFPKLKELAAIYAVNIFDFNRDGLLDIAVAGFGPTFSNFFRWHAFTPTSLVNAENSGEGQINIFKNKGDNQFEIDQQVLNVQKNYFIHAIGVGDFRNKGEQDIWFATDFNTDQPYLFDPSQKRYIPAGEKLGVSTSNGGMNADLGYIDSEIPYIYVTHVYRRGYNIGGNTLWKFDPSTETFVNHAQQLGLNRCGWAWGAKFFDLNNDSHLDLAVTNGMISADKDKDFMFKFGTVTSGSATMVSDFRRWPKIKNHSLSGYERDCLFFNQNGKYHDIAKSIGFDDDLLDGRGLALIDIENNGSQGIVISNQKSRGYLYRVRQENSNNWIGFELKGTKSNRDAIGTKVRIELASGRVLIREHNPLNGYQAQSDDRVHFGVGEEQIQSVKIIWPSGTEQNEPSWRMNKYNFVTENAKPRLAADRRYAR